MSQYSVFSPRFLLIAASFIKWISGSFHFSTSCCFVLLNKCDWSTWLSCFPHVCLCVRTYGYKWVHCSWPFVCVWVCTSKSVHAPSMQHNSNHNYLSICIYLLNLSKCKQNLTVIFLLDQLTQSLLGKNFFKISSSSLTTTSWTDAQYISWYELIKIKM